MGFQVNVRAGVVYTAFVIHATPGPADVERDPHGGVMTCETLLSEGPEC